VNVLREHVDTLKADNERLNAELVAERQRADRALAGLTAVTRERSAARQADREQLAATRAAADKATAELVAWRSGSPRSQRSESRHSEADLGEHGDGSCGTDPPLAGPPLIRGKPLRRMGASDASREFPAGPGTSKEDRMEIVAGAITIPFMLWWLTEEFQQTARRNQTLQFVQWWRRRSANSFSLRELIGEDRRAILQHRELH
jgi:hypothetical protein